MTVKRIGGEKMPRVAASGAGESVEEVADERGGDHHRAGRDHADGDGVEELAVGEPVVLIDHLRFQERHDHQAAAEDEQAGLEEEREEFRARDQHERARGTAVSAVGAKTIAPSKPAAMNISASSRCTMTVMAQATIANDPGDAIGAQRAAAEVPAGFDDERDDGGGDAVEERAQVPVGGEADVEPRRGRHDHERRQAEGDGHGEPADDAEADVAAVDAELVRERSGTGGGEGEAVLEFVRRQPARLSTRSRRMAFVSATGPPKPRAPRRRK